MRIHREGLRTDSAVAAHARKRVFQEGVGCQMERGGSGVERRGEKGRGGVVVNRIGIVDRLNDAIFIFRLRSEIGVNRTCFGS